MANSNHLTWPLEFPTPSCTGLFDADKVPRARAGPPIMSTRQQKSNTMYTMCCCQLMFEFEGKLCTVTFFSSLVRPRGNMQCVFTMPQTNDPHPNEHCHTKCQQRQVKIRTQTLSCILKKVLLNSHEKVSASTYLGFRLQ